MTKRPKSNRAKVLGTPSLKRAKERPPISEFPEPIAELISEPATFAEALRAQMKRFGDSPRSLQRVIIAPGDTFCWETLRDWAQAKKEPRAVCSFELLERVERRYRLPTGYFRSKLTHHSRATVGVSVAGVSESERRRLAWHLPDDFDRRSPMEQAEILDWVRRVIISGATDYRRFQANALLDRYGLRFSVAAAPRQDSHHQGQKDHDQSCNLGKSVDPDLAVCRLRAPAELDAEVSALLKFKTSTLTDIGFQRSGVWNGATASQKVEHLGLLFGALAAKPTSRVRGFGVPPRSLSLGLLVFPSVWDWYVQWRERRRGFYTKWEVDMLRLGLALTRVSFGWLRQSPHLAERIDEVPGLVSAGEIAEARANWSQQCDLLYRHALSRAREIERVARIHRDPFEPILPILESDSPIASYRLITEEVLRRMPDPKRYPRDAAESVRAFLMLRFGLHLGLRQKNLRQLLVRKRGEAPTSERVLEADRRGELRWNGREHAWEVLIPASAFKNSKSSYFAQKPFRLLMPDLCRLYEFIDVYLERHRARLLNGATDPGTFFVKSVKHTSRDAAYDQNTFYEAWRLVIQRYGIFNPYTGRGAIKGLLPHGPHNIRDVIATHILKQTGSYEQASYAIQDTPETVAHHYGRFLPQDKAALAAQVLNKAWTEVPP